jgi:hypothetical protein
MPLFRSFEAPGATGAVSISKGARFQAFGVPLVTVQQAELLKEVRLSCPKRGASGVRRPFWAVALALGLLLGAVLPLGFMFSGSAPVASGREFRPYYSFSWVVPDVSGTYMVEVGLVPAQLTAYDVAWLEVY